MEKQLKKLKELFDLGFIPILEGYEYQNDAKVHKIIMFREVGKIILSLQENGWIEYSSPYLTRNSENISLDDLKTNIEYMELFPEIMLSKEVVDIKITDLPLISRKKKEQIKNEAHKLFLLYKNAKTANNKFNKTRIDINFANRNYLHTKQFENNICEKILQEKMLPLIKKLPSEILETLNIKKNSHSQYVKK